MGLGDGHVVGVSKIVDNGSDADRWNLVIAGDGYTASELSIFRDDVDALVETIWSMAPFNGSLHGGYYRDAINVHRLDVASQESGADDPTACGGSGASVRTYFDASFCNFGMQRLLLVDNCLVTRTVDDHVAKFHAIVVVVNTTIYGGSGGCVATYSRAGGAQRIAIHELGHSAFGLADEYEYWRGCATDTDRNHHPPVEPIEPNVSISDDRLNIKWAALIHSSTPMPTSSNADCTKCDPQPNPIAARTVGAFEGARYYHCDAFRPEFHCMMRSLGQPFCAVCRQRIMDTLSPHLP